MSKRIRVAVIFGGRSNEHVISCISAGGVMRALDRDRYEVVPIGITKTGKWVLESDDASRLVITNGVFPEVDENNIPVLFTADTNSAGLVIQSDVPQVLQQVDVVFPVLHGPFGEDGTIQGLLELAGIPYVGSGVFASAAAMDKGHLKSMMRAAGIPVGPFEVVTDLQWQTDQEAVLDRLSNLGLPLFVKPSRAGSSVGISKVKSYAELIGAIDFARTHDPKVIVEASMENTREIECGVLSTPDGPRASVCAEIIVKAGHEFYDFDAKYVDDSVELSVPAKLDPAIQSRAQQLAIDAFLAIDAEGLARVDMFVTGDEIVINEINTMPGFTPISMYPRMWAESGVDYPALVDALVQDALRRGVGLR
ncbi:MAG: D-alanine--D-alanine ligase family protein [Actinomycetes bacterium]